MQSGPLGQWGPGIRKGEQGGKWGALVVLGTGDHKSRLEGDLQLAAA